MKNIRNQDRIEPGRQRTFQNIEPDDMNPFCHICFLDSTAGKSNNTRMFHECHSKMREAATTLKRECPKPSTDIEEIL